MNELKSTQPIDRLAIALIIALALVMGLLIWGGSACEDNCIFNTRARVNSFSWANQTIGGADRAFILSFNRPTDRQSVEQNLKIVPPLPGKISWSGLRLAYTLKNPVPYGETFQLTLEGAKERFPNQIQSGAVIQPFQAQFRSRDRALAYIGSQGTEEGRLVFYNWTNQQKTILTPPNLTVFEFKPFPQGDRLLFSAADSQEGIEGIQKLQLYTVSTQFDVAQELPQIKLILDNQKYQNNKFDISQDGKTIVVQRLQRSNINNYGLWKITPRHSPQLITNAQVGDFLITPDSQAVATAQGEGIALLPLEANAQPIDFLPRFGQVLDFTVDGTGAAMIDYNTDNPQLRYTRSLYYINNQGIKKELLNTEGSIQSCQFDPTAQHLYCWLTELKKTDQLYVEKPYLAKINLKTGNKKILVKIPQYQESKLSIAPDGLGVLFGRSLDTAPVVRQKSIWLLIPAQDSSNATIEQLPFVGFHPQWMP